MNISYALDIINHALAIDSTDINTLGVGGLLLHFARNDGRQFGRGDALMSLKRPGDALEVYRGVAQSLPDAGRTGMAKAYVALGDRATYLEFLTIDPVWAPLREDPRFESLVKRMGLKWQ